MIVNYKGGPKDDSEKYNPSEWVQNLINNVKSEGHKAHGVFSELDVLKEYNGNIEWREAARYDHRNINFEIITHSQNNSRNTVALKSLFLRTLNYFCVN